MAFALVAGACVQKHRDADLQPAPLDSTVKQDVVARVCRMPQEFHRRGDVGMVVLMHESGYPKVHEQITEADLEEYLRAHPELVEDWVVESDDNRGTPAWCLTDSASSSHSDKQWKVSYLNRDAEMTDVRFFPDRYTASAFYIKRYVEQMLPYRWP